MKRSKRIYRAGYYTFINTSGTLCFFSFWRSRYSALVTFFHVVSVLFVVVSFFFFFLIKITFHFFIFKRERKKREKPIIFFSFFFYLFLFYLYLGGLFCQIYLTFLSQFLTLKSDISDIFVAIFDFFVRYF